MFLRGSTLWPILGMTRTTRTKKKSLLGDDGTTHTILEFNEEHFYFTITFLSLFERYIVFEGEHVDLPGHASAWHSRE